MNLYCLVCWWKWYRNCFFTCWIVLLMASDLPRPVSRCWPVSGLVTLLTDPSPGRSRLILYSLKTLKMSHKLRWNVATEPLEMDPVQIEIFHSSKSALYYRFAGLLNTQTIAGKEQRMQFGWFFSAEVCIMIMILFRILQGERGLRIYRVSTKDRFKRPLDI